MNAWTGKSAITRSEITATCGGIRHAPNWRTGILMSLALSVCFIFLPIAAQAQVNPEIAKCSELKDEGTIFQADICASHIGCRFVLNVQKSCARAKEYLGRLGDAIGQGARTLFSHRKEVTPDAVFTAALNDEARSNERKLDTFPESRRLSQEIAAGVREVERGDILTGTDSAGNSWVYYGQTGEGKEDGWGTFIGSNGYIRRGQSSYGLVQARRDILFAQGGRSVTEYVHGDPTVRGAIAYQEGTASAGAWRDGNFEGKKYRADGTLEAQGRFDKAGLWVGTKYDTSGVRTEVNLPRERELAKRAQTEKALGDWAPLTEDQRKREQAEQQFRASLQTMNPGQLFARADELNAQGDRDRAREAQRALMSRFPDHPLAATAARQMAGDTGSAPSSGGSAVPADTAVAANGPSSVRLSNQTCEAMLQSVVATKVPPNASVTAAMETVMFMTKTEIDMMDGGCPPNPGVTQSQMAAARKERQTQKSRPKAAFYTWRKRRDSNPR
jgi:hypothetical protein